ncbi:MAG: heavy metal-binding domain-containing protein [Vitreoscilla sp.]
MSTKPRISGLSGNEIYCMHLKGYEPVGIVVGNSVRSMGFIGGLTSGVRGVIGGEIPEITQIIHEGRQNAYDRMVAEVKEGAAHGAVGVASELRNLAGNTEYLFVGSSVRHGADNQFFTSAGDAQELYCHMDAGYAPRRYVFGNIAYSMGAIGGIIGGLKTMVRGEIKEFSDIFNATRHHALERAVKEARRAGANAVVGIRTSVERFNGAHEMFMSGTAAINPALPAQASQDPVTSDLTGEELWSLTAMGFAPLKLLMSTSVYSLGAIGGLKSLFKGFVKGEISDLTTLVYDAREHVFHRIEQEAAELGADRVVGIKTYIVEIGSGLIEFVAVGTAVRRMSGLAVATPALPPQAIVRDKDTWVSGEGGFDLQGTRAGA